MNGFKVNGFKVVSVHEDKVVLELDPSTPSYVYHLGFMRPSVGGFDVMLPSERGSSQGVHLRGKKLRIIVQVVEDGS
ncbi:MAG: hypothetical protein ACXQT2_04475 [Methanotrichaceae archaeon]